MAYFVVKSVVQLLGRMHGIFYFEEFGVALRKNSCHILR